MILISDAYSEIASMAAPRGMQAWLWEVQPRDSEAPLIGLGVSDAEYRARAALEDTLERYHDDAAYGIMHGPKCIKWRCTRGIHGGFVWRLTPR